MKSLYRLALGLAIVAIVSGLFAMLSGVYLHGEEAVGWGAFFGGLAGLCGFGAIFAWLCGSDA